MVLIVVEMMVAAVMTTAMVAKVLEEVVVNMLEGMMMLV